MTQDFAPDEPAEPRLPARMKSAVSAVLGIAVALLLAALPGASVNGARAQSALSVASTDQLFLATTNRLGEMRASLQKVRGPAARRLDFGDTPVLLGGLATLLLLAFAAVSHRPARVLAQRPVRRRSTTQARAPPRA